MKTQSYKFWMAPVIVIAIMNLVACAKNSDSPQPAAVVVTPPGPNITGCANCFAGAAMMIQNAQTSSGYGNLSMGVDIYGSSSIGYDFGNPKVFLSYSGPIYVEAYMQINTANYYCNAPAGEYMVTTVQAGNSSMGVMYGMVLQAQGPAQMILRVSNSTIYNTDMQGVTRDSQNNRLGLNLYIESVNGQSCGIPVSTY